MCIKQMLFPRHVASYCLRLSHMCWSIVVHGAWHVFGFLCPWGGVPGVSSSRIPRVDCIWQPKVHFPNISETITSRNPGHTQKKTWRAGVSRPCSQMKPRLSSLSLLVISTE